MNFVSLIFVGFLVITLGSYYVAPLRLRWIILLISSIVFYASAGLEKIPWMLCSAVIAYVGALGVQHIYERCGDRKTARKRGRVILTISVLLLFLVLIWSKTGAELLGALNKLFHCSGLDTAVIVPLGVSYYTFSATGYLADVYWNRDKVEKNPLKLLLFLIFFPHILQGPIARHKRMAVQLYEGHPFDYRNICFGLQRMVWGYFKKMVIADRLVKVVSSVFSNCENYEGIVFIVALAAAAVQLYCDFSGCMDIVIGASECFSIHLDENFSTPFYSRSAAEFWRRWHITLGAWFKDYVYMPLVTSPSLIKISAKIRKLFGKRAAKSFMALIPLSIVWILTGLWHGTGPDYIVWGCYWGSIIIVSHIFSPEIKRLTDYFHINTDSRLWRRFQIVRTFCLFCFGRLLTVPANLRTSADIFRSMVTCFNPWVLFDGTLYTLGIDRQEFWIVLAATAILWLVSNKKEKGINVREAIAEEPVVIRWGTYYLLIIAVLIFGVYGSNTVAVPFAYGNF